MVIWFSVANLSRVSFLHFFIIYDTHKFFVHVYLFGKTSEKLSGFPDVYRFRRLSLCHLCENLMSQPLYQYDKTKLTTKLLKNCKFNTPNLARYKKPELE